MTEVSAPTELVVRRWRDLAVQSANGYFNATLCAAHFGKLPNDYLRLPRTREYLEALGSEMKCADQLLVQAQRGGSCQGTWLHPRVMLDFARWLDARFAVWADTWVLEVLKVASSRVEAPPTVPPAPQEQSVSVAARQQAARPTPLFRYQLCILNEQDLQVALVQYLRRAHPRAVIVGGLCELIEPADQRKLAVQMGYTAGQPDLLILNSTTEHGGFAVEFKHPGFALSEKAPTERQLEYHRRLRELGWRVEVCNDVFHAAREIDAYLAKARRSCDCCSVLWTEEELSEHLRRKRRRRPAAEATA